MSNLSGLVGNLMNNHEMLQKKLLVAQVKNKAFRAENEAAQMENEFIRAENEAAQVENKAFRAENEAFRAEIKELRMTLAQMCEEIARRESAGTATTMGGAGASVDAVTAVGSRHVHFENPPGATPVDSDSDDDSASATSELIVGDGEGVDFSEYITDPDEYPTFDTDPTSGAV